MTLTKDDGTPPLTEQSQLTKVSFTPEFKRNLRQLAKKYRDIKADVQPIIDDLSQGNVPGDQIPGVQYEVFKVRASNSNSNRGKSGGYRIIYQRTIEGCIILVTIYSKTEQADVTAGKIQEIIVDHDMREAKVEDNVE